MRSIADFKQEVAQHYTGPSLEVTVDRDPTKNSTGDGIPWRSLYTLLVCLASAQDLQDKIGFRKCMAVREAGGPGLYHRNPGDTTNNSIDAIVYAAAASKAIELDRAVARALLHELRLYRWHWNDQEPTSMDARYWMGRFLWLPGFLCLCAGEDLEAIDRLPLAASLLFAPARDDCSAILLGWVVAMTVSCAGGIVGWLARRQLARLAALRPGGMAEVCADYFNRQGEPPHPFSWPEVWHGGQG